MLAVVDETIGREAPRVAALRSRDQQVAAALDRGKQVHASNCPLTRESHHRPLL